jgi:hypothetical protein
MTVDKRMVLDDAVPKRWRSGAALNSRPQQTGREFTNGAQ